MKPSFFIEFLSILNRRLSSQVELPEEPSVSEGGDSGRGGGVTMWVKQKEQTQTSIPVLEAVVCTPAVCVHCTGSLMALFASRSLPIPSISHPNSRKIFF